ncbi:MAG: hypothetical protein LBQ87_07240 [Candidatus Fibromonas sp.]|nr:hypothetical protein [Candidatus Fibromonas sp.]
MLCSFCSKSEPVQIDISSLYLRICPNCRATFLPATQFAELRRKTDDATKGAWIRKLNATEAVFCSDPVCLEHKVPLITGTIPEYSFEGLIPTCCNLQHIPPSLMVKILGLGIGAGFGASRSKRKINPVSEFLGGIVFYFWKKKQKNVEDGLDRLQYNYKFKDVLGEWVD